MAGAVAGLLVALVIPAALRRAAVLAPARRPLARVALLELAREPGPAAIAAAGLAVSVGLAGFAFAYRATLERSRSDQAGHRVPVTAVVSPGPSLRSPLAVSPLTAWAGLRGARDAAAVVRRDAFVIAGPTRDPVTAVGVPARLLGSLPTWRAADAQGDRGALARRLIAPPFDRPPGGVRLDSAGEGLVLPARADGDRVRVSALVRDRGGTLDRVVLGTAGAHTAPLHARLPARDRGGQLAGIVVEPDLGLLVTITHHIAEGGNGGTATGVLHLGRLRAGTTTLRLAGWQPHGPLRGRPRALHYHLEGPALLRPAQPSDRAPLPVLADPATAHDSAIANGVVLDILGVQVRARVVGVVRRLPTVPSGHGLVLADATALAGALDAQVPGNGEARELWLSARPGQTGELDAAVGAAARRHGLVLHTHAAAQRALAAEPIGREVLGALAAAAALAAALGLLGVAIALRRALRDGSGALLDLEAQGLGPAALRRGLRLRGAAIAVAGVLPGLVLAVALTSLVTGAVRAGAAGTPDPPLVSVVPWTDGALAALGLLIGAAVVGALAVAPSLREAVPRAAALTESA
jgi:hypothetical protein